MNIHPRLTEALILRAAKRSMFGDNDPIGFCVECGRKAKGYVEPDAERYMCQFASCGKSAVYGAEQLLIMTVA